jgi:hypothetical protein
MAVWSGAFGFVAIASYVDVKVDFQLTVYVLVERCKYLSSTFVLLCYCYQL